MENIDFLRELLESKNRGFVDTDVENAWNNIPNLNEGEYEDVSEINDEYCPYCNKEVGFCEDIYPPKDCIGKKKYGLYETIIFRKCPNCGKVFTETFGEKPDYEYY